VTLHVHKSDQLSFDYCTT